jgi:integrase/recombinase XerD
MRLCRQQYKGRDGKTRESAKWYAEIKDHDGRRRRIPGFTDKGATAELGRQVEKLVALRVVKQPPNPELSAWLEGMPATFTRQLAAWGIIDGQHLPNAKTLRGHLDDFHAGLLAKGDTPEHADLLRGRIRQILNDCRFAYLSDVSASALQTYLAERRRIGARADATSVVESSDQKDRRKGIGAQTSNFYLSAFKQFCRWMVRDRRASHNPVDFLDGVNVKLDRRHDRRNLTADELSKLLRATATGPVRHKLGGVSRAMLYRVAMETGLRRNELRSLTLASLELDSEPPAICVAPASVKNRKQTVQPMRRELADELRSWLQSREMAPESPLWPALTNHTSKMLKADLGAAGIAYVDASGRFADFHALRHSYISLITQGGVHPKLAQRLARHSDINLTMSRYSHTLLADEADALDVLPAFPSVLDGPQPDRQTLAATGTDDASATRESVLPNCLPKTGAFEHTSTHFDAQTEAAPSIRFEASDDAAKGRKHRENARIRRASESGEGGIRTPGRVAPTPVFKTGAIDRSATSPGSAARES